MANELYRPQIHYTPTRNWTNAGQSVDRSSVEIFNADGTMAMINIVFPKEPYNIISGVAVVCCRELKSIW